MEGDGKTGAWSYGPQLLGSNTSGSFFALMHVCVMLRAAKWMQQMEVETVGGAEKIGLSPCFPNNSPR